MVAHTCKTGLGKLIQEDSSEFEASLDYRPGLEKRVEFQYWLAVQLGPNLCVS